ncbi:PcfJ domain-containing protein [Novipirellula artificiosorum]|nr:PcfJ domain-containing protein [Novipirellula artificiosorum]
MLRRERDHAASLTAKHAMHMRRQHQVSEKQLLTGIASGEIEKDSIADPHVGRFAALISHLVQHNHRTELRKPVFRRKDLVVLLEHLQSVGCKLHDKSNRHRSLSPGGISILESLVLVAHARPQWVRPLGDWKPRTHNAKRQFHSLLRHLFDRFGEVPLFMDHAWTMGTQTGGGLDPKGVEFRDWYLHLGVGRSLRDQRLPLKFTKRMAHQFKDAPADVTIPQALRWAQVIGLGGDERLARAVAGTRLADDFEHDDFWTTVLRWLMEQSMLDLVQIGPMLDYIHHQRFVPQRVFGILEDHENPQPAEPNFTMKGRTANSLLRQVEAWHRALAGSNRIQIANWKPVGIAGFEFMEGNETSGNAKIWTIRELLCSRSLVVEGRNLNHCVATYASSCSRGGTSIWTLEVETNTEVDKRITIEVRPTSRTIVQARGRSNRLMKEQERGIVRRWCAQAGLTLSPGV